MTQHTWHKEIHAWADGAEIEYLSEGYGWQVTNKPEWCEESEYRIKPKENRPISNTWLKELEARIEKLERIENLRKEHGAGR
jgi:hypothetical protein